MNSFYHKNLTDGLNTLSEEESKHCIQVLRHKVGDEILILDGNGGKHHAVLTDVTKKSCSFEVIESTHIPQKPFTLHLAIAPTKNIDRMEWLVEKLTEIGVDQISLIQTANSERRKIRLDRLEKKALSALKQSKNPFLPKLNDLVTFNDFLSEVNHQKKLIAHVDPKYPYIGSAMSSGEDVSILIGPEGDFTESEVDLALQKGFQPVSLGTHTLRTETAGLMACYAVNLINTY